MKQNEPNTLPGNPDWHNNPQRLTKQEIRNPHLVLEEFFKRYQLKDIRHCMKEWLVEAISPHDVVATVDLISLHNSIDKLIEAAWLLHKNRKPETNCKPGSYRVKITAQI